jgi:hypothetical protein
VHVFTFHILIYCSWTKKHPSKNPSITLRAGFLARRDWDWEPVHFFN